MPVLPSLVANAISMLLAAVALRLAGAPPQVVAHVAFAMGMLPLILAVIAYFVPVLTRTAGEGWQVAWAAMAWSAGIAVVSALVPYIGSHWLAPLAATLGLAVATTLLGWMLRRARLALGRPHPCLDWYLAALGFLVLALLAVLAMEVLPGYRAALRLVHLHANLLGFVGLTAIGTTQVLLPTAANQQDPGVAGRLRAELGAAAGGALLIALGAAGPKPMAYVGGFLYLWPLLRLVSHWARAYAGHIARADGVAPSLGLAMFGLLGLVLLGFGHAGGSLEGRDAVSGFILAFLLPLVTGAASQLLPIWLWAGPQNEAHKRLRARLGRYSGWRALAMVLGGLTAAIGLSAGVAIAALGILLFGIPWIEYAVRKNGGA